MKTILGILCHPDDEVICGWPIFQRNDVEKHLVILCDDAARKGPGRVDALEEVCEKENIHIVKVLSEDNNFYALPTRRAENVLSDSVQRINDAITLAVQAVNPDYVFTHNPVGFYGHGSHRLCWELVSQHPSVQNLIFTDMCEASNHRSSNKIPGIIKEAYYTSEFTIREHEQKLDLHFHERCWRTYDKHRAWTWSKPPITKCNLYYLRTQNV